MINIKYEIAVYYAKKADKEFKKLNEHYDRKTVDKAFKYFEKSLKFVDTKTRAYVANGIKDIVNEYKH